jgi:ribosomal protein L3 glutamine methyltransferase
MLMRIKSIDKSRALRDAIRWAETELSNAGVHCGHGTMNTADEAAWLAGSALGVAPSELERHLGDALDAGQRTRIATLIEQRIETRKPTAYLLKEAWFAGLSFYVDERVIVPRSLTAEFIRERFAPWIESARVHRLLDLGTGSGCMAIAAAVAFPRARVDAVDISTDALAVARINVERHDLLDRVQLVRSDLYRELAAERYDVILTNPPYVAREELRKLPPEYRFEPIVALDAGVEGLDLIVRILADASPHLEPNGILIAEVGSSRDALEHVFPEVPFVWLTTSSGDESVFLLTEETIAQHARAFLKAANSTSR